MVRRGARQGQARGAMQGRGLCALRLLGVSRHRQGVSRSQRCGREEGVHHGRWEVIGASDEAHAREACSRLGLVGDDDDGAYTPCSLRPVTLSVGPARRKDHQGLLKSGCHAKSFFSGKMGLGRPSTLAKEGTIGGRDRPPARRSKPRDSHGEPLRSADRLLAGEERQQAAPAAGDGARAESVPHDALPRARRRTRCARHTHTPTACALALLGKLRPLPFPCVCA